MLKTIIFSASLQNSQAHFYFEQKCRIFLLKSVGDIRKMLRLSNYYHLFLLLGIAHSCNPADQTATRWSGFEETAITGDLIRLTLADLNKEATIYDEWDKLLYTLSYDLSNLEKEKARMQKLLADAGNARELIKRKSLKLGKCILTILGPVAAQKTGILAILQPYLSANDYRDIVEDIDTQKAQQWLRTRAQEWSDTVEAALKSDTPDPLARFWRDHPHHPANRLLTRISWDKQEARTAFFEAIARKKTRVAAALLAKADKVGLWHNMTVARLYPRTQALQDLWVALWQKIIDGVKAEKANQIIQSTLKEIEAFFVAFDPSRSMLFKKLWGNGSTSVMELSVIQEHPALVEALAIALSMAAVSPTPATAPTQTRAAEQYWSDVVIAFLKEPTDEYRQDYLLTFIRESPVDCFASLIGEYGMPALTLLEYTDAPKKILTALQNRLSACAAVTRSTDLDDGLYTGLDDDENSQYSNTQNGSPTHLPPAPSQLRPSTPSSLSEEWKQCFEKALQDQDAHAVKTFCATHHERLSEFINVELWSLREGGPRYNALGFAFRQEVKNRSLIEALIRAGASATPFSLYPRSQ